MATNAVLSGTPTEDAALSYTLDPPASVATSQVGEFHRRNGVDPHRGRHGRDLHPGRLRSR
jgi:hypothetical protein